MAFPRLAPSTNPYNLSVTIDVNLRPYFERWYAEEQLPGEDPSQFALRKLKEQASSDYLNYVLPDERKTVDDQRNAGLASIAADIESFKGELDVQ